MYKPLPYTFLRDCYPSRQFAQWLRGVFTPLLRRRMPTVYYSGFTHRFIPDFVSKYKKEYPYFVKLDIAKFYPSISHQELLVATQMAYKKLIASSFVPKKFKQEFLPQATAFLSRLPLQKVGLPLNSGVSKAWAPLIYVPILLDICKRYELKYVAFVDDFLLLCKDAHTATEVYAALLNGFNNLGLLLNLPKVQSGRLGTQSVEFCGWRFVGGYVGVQESKVQRFRDRIEMIVKRYRRKALNALIKKLNYQILGFGHYYKYGTVKRLYESLDVFISKTIYTHYLRNRVTVEKGAYKRFLKRNGLKELVGLLPTGVKTVTLLKKSTTVSKPKHYQVANDETVSSIPYLEKIIEQQKQMIGLLKDMRKIAKGFEW